MSDPTAGDNYISYGLPPDENSTTIKKDDVLSLLDSDHNSDIFMR